MTEDILSRIEQAIGCQQCGKTLPEDGPSQDFCDQCCQQAWHAKRIESDTAMRQSISEVESAIDQEVSSSVVGIPRHLAAAAERRAWFIPALDRHAEQATREIIRSMDRLTIQAGDATIPVVLTDAVPPDRMIMVSPESRFAADLAVLKAQIRCGGSLTSAPAVATPPLQEPEPGWLTRAIRWVFGGGPL